MIPIFFVCRKFLLRFLAFTSLLLGAAVEAVEVAGRRVRSAPSGGVPG